MIKFPSSSNVMPRLEMDAENPEYFATITKTVVIKRSNKDNAVVCGGLPRNSMNFVPSGRMRYGYSYCRLCYILWCKDCLLLTIFGSWQKSQETTDRKDSACIGAVDGSRTICLRACTLYQGSWLFKGPLPNKHPKLCSKLQSQLK